MNSDLQRCIELGLEASSAKMCQEDRLWSRYSHDKVDIGEVLAEVLRTLSKDLPLRQKLRALSVGSSSEPQLRILEAAFQGGVYLFDLDEKALDIVKERIQRQSTRLVKTINGDYTKTFFTGSETKQFLSEKLEGRPVELITLHHSLYYCRAADWRSLFDNLYGTVLADRGAMHSVLMSSESKEECTTTWLYNHFAGKFFGCRNDQDLLKLRPQLRKDPMFKKAEILTATHRVRFFVKDFKKFMAVIWMILLYPNVHKYSLKQREEITEFVYKHFWIKKRPLIQSQDHVVVYKGIGFKGLI